MTANRIFLNNDGGLTLIVRDHHREFGVKFNTMELMQKYCDKARIVLPENFRGGYKYKKIVA